MPDRDVRPETAKPRSVPEIISPTKRSASIVNVALPFSNIEVAGPSRELANLAGVVTDLINALEGVVPDPVLADLRERASRIVG
jgi:hypothetical protein